MARPEYSKPWSGDIAEIEHVVQEQQKKLYIAQLKHKYYAEDT